MSTRDIRYLGHSLKRLDPATHGRAGYRHQRTGREYRTMRDAKAAIAAMVFPYRLVGGPPIGRRSAR